MFETQHVHRQTNDEQTPMNNRLPTERQKARRWQLRTNHKRHTTDGSWWNIAVRQWCGGQKYRNRACNNKGMSDYAGVVVYPGGSIVVAAATIATRFNVNSEHPPNSVAIPVNSHISYSTTIQYSVLQLQNMYV